MIKGFVSAAFCAMILVFLDMIFWSFAPKITCDQLREFLVQMVKSSIIEYFIFILLLILINKFISILNKKEHLISIAIFSGTFIIEFAYHCYDYAQKLQCVN